MNLLEGEVSADGIAVEGNTLALDERDGLRAGDRVLVGVRAENLGVSHTQLSGALPGRVRVVEPLGSHLLVTINIGSQQVKVTTPVDSPVRGDEDVWIMVKPGSVRLLQPATR